MGEPADAGVVSDADVAASIAAQEPAVEPQATPEPAVEPEKGTEDFDRSSSFKDALQGVLEHVRDDQKETVGKILASRIEQAERWAASEDEAKELKRRFESVQSQARAIQNTYQFQGGEEYLKEQGAGKYLEAAFARIQEIQAAQSAQAEPDPEPGEDDRLAQLEAKWAAKEQQEAEAAERDAHAKAFAAEFDPAAEKAVKAFGLSAEDEAAVAPIFCDLAQQAYLAGVVNNPDNPSAVTVTGTIRDVSKMIDTIVSARSAKRPPPSRPTVQPIGQAKKATDGPTDFDEANQELSNALNAGVDEAWSKG
jgi:hypothetical protein